MTVWVKTQPAHGDTDLCQCNSFDYSMVDEACDFSLAMVIWDQSFCNQGVASATAKGLQIQPKRLVRETSTHTGQTPTDPALHSIRVHHTLIFSKDHRRQQLTSQAQELIYREAELILSRCSQNPIRAAFSWGNLPKKHQRTRTGDFNIFLSCQPFLPRETQCAPKLADLIFTDSKATQRFYQGHTESPIQVLPKIIAQPSSTISADKRWAKKTVSLINPCLKKGLKQFIALAHNCQQSGDPFHFLLIDAAGKLDRDLHKLQLTREQLPANIQIRPGTPDTDLLLADSSILMLLSIWHESGSRLIHEAHQRSITVLAFATGGTPELMQHTPADLFPAPDNNSQWDPSALTKRLRELLGDRSLYGRHAKQLQHHTHQLETANRAGAIDALQQALRAKNMQKQTHRQI